jgi:hypothetical protein
MIMKIKKAGKNDTIKPKNGLIKPFFCSNTYR